jgi:hypothetical protein
MEKYEKGLQHIAQVQGLNRDILEIKGETKELAIQFIQLRNQYEKAIDSLNSKLPAMT